MVHDQRSSVVRGRVGGVRKRVLPSHDVEIAFELDGGKDVFSASSGPRFRNDGTCLERAWLVAELVDDGVPKLRREP